MTETASFVRLFAGFLLIAAGVHASCPIELSPPSVVVRYGDPVSINCSTSVTQFQGMGWEATKGGTGLRFSNHLTWALESLTQWTISPSCYINLPPDTQCTLYPNIVVYTFPETIGISSSAGSGGVMRENEEYNIICDIHNVAPVQNLTVRFYKGDTIVKEETSGRQTEEPVNVSSVFSFIPKRNENGVTFRCEAHLNLEPEGPQLKAVSQEYNVTVYFGPDIQCSALALPEWETLDKHCSVTGNPPPVVTWLKDGQPTDPTTPLSRKEAGGYTVKAEGASFVKEELQVFVMYGPELQCPSTYTTQEYAHHNLTCISGGYPQPVTTWYKDGEEVQLPEGLTRRDSGLYHITASNILSSVNLTVDIIVTYPPSQMVELEDSEVDVGSSLWLKCSSMGNPRPNYLWDYFQTHNIMEENEDGVSRLLIHNATAYNTGYYTCHAWNDRGNVSQTVRVTVKGVKQGCPIEIIPDRMVLQHQSRGQNATCRPTSIGSSNQEGELYWQVHGAKTDSTYWFADPYKDWDPTPVCSGRFKGIGTCWKRLDFTLYKTPDSVSIRRVDNSTSVLEESEFQLQCDITNVAPTQNLVVRWYQGNETFEQSDKGSIQVTGCQPENNTDCGISSIRSPRNVSSTINITLNRTQNGAEFRCEAQLDLGSVMPPNMTSSPLNITVYYKPVINTTKLPKRIPLFTGYSEELICEADGHPPPKILWLYSSGGKVSPSSVTKLTVTEAGFYNCTATNEVDSVSYEVEVILKVDYLPLIAGFVAVTVVVISGIFVFIYSIYYKNTKMRRYSLKNPKSSTHNGNVAHNGWDLQFPMTKLS